MIVWYQKYNPSALGLEVLSMNEQSHYFEAQNDAPFPAGCCKSSFNVGNTIVFGERFSQLYPIHCPTSDLLGMEDSSRSRIGTCVQITAVDGIVNVNSLFTLAVFIGLAWNPYDSANSLITDPICNPTTRIAEDLVSFHVYSFSSFLFSSLVALGIKQAIRIARSREMHQIVLLAHVNQTALRLSMLVSAIGSLCGCGFLMLALVNMVQIKLGTLSCGSPQTLAAVVPLVIFVPVGLLIYVGIVLYAFLS